MVGLTHVVGTVSMARGTGADTPTSDFFILLNDQPSLDMGGKRFDDGQGAAAFGRVVSGMDVAIGYRLSAVRFGRTNKRTSRYCDAPLLHWSGSPSIHGALP